MAQSTGYIAVDLDGTLAVYNEWEGLCTIGEPVPLMVKRVKKWLEEGKRVKIFTARVGPQDLSRKVSEYDVAAARTAIENWCLVQLGQKLEITNEKDFAMIELWDDRCVPVEKNTGRKLLAGAKR